MRLLHLTEAYSSGVAVAIESYIERTPASVEIEVCGYRRPEAQTGPGIDLPVPFVALPAGRWAQWRAVEAAVDRFRPDVVHLHSSWAGALGRITRRTHRTVYTPHAYGFLRSDLPRPVRLGILASERALKARTDAIVACGEHEAELARRFGLAREVYHVPQRVPERIRTRVAQLNRLNQLDQRSPDGAFRVGMVGRVSPQKGPAFMANVARELRGSVAARPVELVWIGGGDRELERVLRDQGVSVTGWLPQHDALQALAGLDLYLHTASWEGSAMTVLEAELLGLPVVARQIDGLGHGLSVDLVTTPADAARAIRDAAQAGSSSRRAAPPAAEGLPASEVLSRAYGL